MGSIHMLKSASASFWGFMPDKSAVRIDVEVMACMLHISHAWAYGRVSRSWEYFPDPDAPEKRIVASSRGRSGDLVPCVPA